MCDPNRTTEKNRSLKNTMGNCHGGGGQERERTAAPPQMAPNPVAAKIKPHPAVAKSEPHPPPRRPRPADPPPKPTVRQHVEAVVSNAIRDHMQSECMHLQRTTIHELSTKLRLMERRWIYLQGQVRTCKRVIEKQRTVARGIGRRVRALESGERGPRLFHLRMFGDARCFAFDEGGRCCLSAERGITVLSKTGGSESFALKTETGAFLTVNSDASLGVTCRSRERAVFSFEGPLQRFDVRVESPLLSGVLAVKPCGGTILFTADGPETLTVATGGGACQWRLIEAADPTGRVKEEAAVVIQARFRGVLARTRTFLPPSSARPDPQRGDFPANVAVLKPRALGDVPQMDVD